MLILTLTLSLLINIYLNRRSYVLTNSLHCMSNHRQEFFLKQRVLRLYLFIYFFFFLYKTHRRSLSSLLSATFVIFKVRIHREIQAFYFPFILNRFVFHLFLNECIKQVFENIRDFIIIIQQEIEHFYFHYLLALTTT